MFRVGQKVVCVPVGPGIGGCLEAIRGKVITIEAISSCCGSKLVMVTVNGVSTTCSKCSRNHGGEFYCASHFRPIQDQSVSFELSLELLESIVEERPEHINEPEPA